MHLEVIVLKVLLLLLFITVTTPAFSQEAVVDPWQRALEQKRPCESLPKESYPWYDKAHLFLSDAVCQRAIWFDNFFAPDDEIKTDKQATSLLWLTLPYRWNQRNGKTFKPRLKGIVELPYTKRRLKLIIEGEDETRLTTEGESKASDEGSSAVLRYSPFNFSQWDVDLDLGLRFGSGPFTRARARYYHPFNSSTIGTLSQEFVVNYKEVWYEISRANLAYYTSEAVYRFLNHSKYGEQTLGMTWGSQLSRTSQLSQRAALTLFVSAEGAKEDLPGTHSEIYRLGMHYRRSIWRPWFSYELEPQLTFPREYDYKETWQITAGIEIQMGKSRKRGYY